MLWQFKFQIASLLLVAVITVLTTLGAMAVVTIRHMFNLSVTGITKFFHSKGIDWGRWGWTVLQDSLGL